MSTGPEPKPLFFLAGEIKTPPFSREARREAGELMRRVQDGESLGMPHSRPMPSIGPRVHELRVRDESANWRVVYRIDADLILVVEIFEKTTRVTPKRTLDLCKKRLRDYDA